MNQGKNEIFESELSEEQERKNPLIPNFNAVKKSLKVASEVFCYSGHSLCLNP